MLKNLWRKLPLQTRETLYLRGFGLTKIPLLLSVSPSIIRLTEEQCEVKIPLNWFTKNHLNSMYFGALCVGADCAGGMIAVRALEEKKLPIGFVFKDMKAQFLKRAEGDVHFLCVQGREIHELLEKAMNTGQRENLPVKIVCTCPSLSNEPVAEFELNLSVKKLKVDK